MRGSLQRAYRLSLPLGREQQPNRLRDGRNIGAPLHRRPHAELGLREVRYQENYREEWQLGNVVFDLDTWPSLPTFLEIEGPDEPAVRQAAEQLGLDYAQARFGSVDEIYKTETGRDILAEPTLLFGESAVR